MDNNKTVRLGLKITISLISISVLLTTVIGAFSIIQVLKDQSNINVESTDVDMNLGILGNYFNFDLYFSNEDGYFDFENFTANVKFILQNKNTHENITLLDKILYSNTLESGQTYDISIIANEDDFIIQNFLNFNNNSWHDPVIAAVVNYDSIILNSTAIRSLNYAFLLWHYDVFFSITIGSNYNLNLIWFGFTFDFIIDYNTYFTENYPTTRDNALALLGF